MLVDKLISAKEHYETLRSFTVRLEKINHVFTKVYFEKSNTVIEFGVDEYDGYITIVVTQSASKGVISYYALSDYGTIKPNPVYIFDVIKSIDETWFRAEMSACLKKRFRKTVPDSQTKLVGLVCLLVNSLLLEIINS